MRRILSLVLILTLMMSVQVSANSLVYQKDTLSEKHDFVEDKNDLGIMEIAHHICGYGGTSCRPCEYYMTLKDYCGCIVIVYKCCCGKQMVNGGSLCSSHKSK